MVVSFNSVMVRKCLYYNIFVYIFEEQKNELVAGQYMFKDLFWRRLCSNEGITLTVYLLLYDMTLWAVMWCDPKVIGQDLFCEENGIKMKQKLTFALLIYEQKRKLLWKKGCDLWFAM